MNDLISRQAANTNMKKYRKKPIVIEAYKTDVALDIETLEGIMHASVGDYIITGVNGEQYPCKPDIFKKTYEEISSAQPERTCVNCGRTVNNGGWYADGGTRCPIEEHYALPKDGFCHLWEKRNVTDDDYPERRTDE